jgi:ATP:ADP antiporter, AAA family
MTVETGGENSGAMALLRRGLARALPATPQERAAALWSFAYFFTLLAGYYVLRPLRDQMAITGGIRNLPWLFTATFATLLVAQPLYGMLVAKLPRARFIPLVNHFFVVNLALFWLFLTLQIETALVARMFYVWVAVFSLFSVAVFWSFMADLFTADQGKRLFGFIGAGGTSAKPAVPEPSASAAAPLQLCRSSFDRPISSALPPGSRSSRSALPSFILNRSTLSPPRSKAPGHKHDYLPESTLR